MKKIFAGVVVVSIFVVLATYWRFVLAPGTEPRKNVVAFGVILLVAFLMLCATLYQVLVSIYRDQLRSKDIKPTGSAHFQLCDCGKHGRVVFPDGRTGGEVASKEDAVRYLQYAVLVGFYQTIDTILNYELADLKDELEASSLPASANEVSEYLEKTLNTWNWGKLHQPKLDPADFHKVQEKLWFFRPE